MQEKILEIAFNSLNTNAGMRRKFHLFPYTERNFPLFGARTRQERISYPSTPFDWAFALKSPKADHRTTHSPAELSQWVREQVSHIILTMSMMMLAGGPDRYLLTVVWPADNATGQNKKYIKNHQVARRCRTPDKTFRRDPFNGHPRISCRSPDSLSMETAYLFRSYRF